MSLPTSVQLAQTLAATAKALQLCDQVQITPSPPPQRLLDLKV